MTEIFLWIALPVFLIDIIFVAVVFLYSRAIKKNSENGIEISDNNNETDKSDNGNMSAAKLPSWLMWVLIALIVVTVIMLIVSTAVIFIMKMK